MRKNIFLLAFSLLFCLYVCAQNSDQKIVFDFVKSDTADFKIMVAQLNNVLKEAPNTSIKVVCSGPGLFMLVSNKTNVAKEMDEIQKVFKVTFEACANSMRRLKVEKNQLVPFAKTVPVAILELASLQQQGWSYIKAGIN